MKNDNNKNSVGDGRELERLINRRHPEYEALCEQWRFFGDTYHGGREWFKTNIFKYFREGDKEYEERVERAYRFNHTKEVVDLINKYLFKQAIQRAPGASDAVKSFWKHATSGGASINELAKQISKNCSIYGRIGVVVDRDRVQGDMITIKEAKEHKVRTYAYIVNPADMLDYSFDDNGDLNWILIRESYRDDGDPFGQPSLQLQTRYRLWTKHEWFLFTVESEKGRKDVRKVEQGTHGLGEVPVVLADNFLSDEKYYSASLVNDIAYLDRAVANYLSDLDNIIQDQTFSQLVLPAQNVMAGTDEESQLFEIGTKRIFTYDAGGSNHGPEYISPDPSQAHLILDAVARIIREIYNSVGLASERTNKDNAVSMDNSSGVAKAYDFERVNALLLAKADSLEIVENKIARLVALWNGEKAEDQDFVVYPDNFDTRGLYDEFDIAARLMLVDAPRSIRQEQMKAVVKKLFPLLDDAIQKKIEEEIKDWLDPEMMLDDISMRTAQNNLTDPTSTLYTSKTGGKGEATRGADGSPVDHKRPFVNNRQGEVTKNTP